MEKIVNDFLNSLLSMNRVKAKMIIETYKKDNRFVDEIITPALEKIGFGWEKNQLSLAQVYMTGKICEEILNDIFDENPPKKILPKNAAICVLEDQHLLGKRIVISMLKSAGYDIVDYGSLPTSECINEINRKKIDIMLISTLMLNSALKIIHIKEAIIKSNLNTKIIVGGAPFRFDTSLWQEVGADAMGYNASDALELFKKFSEG